MPFPDYERVIYQRNPLVEVICQVRYPPILRIDVEPPAGFQDEIRADFPVLTESSDLDGGLSLPPDLARQVPPVIAQQLSAFRFSSSQKSYSFASEDGDWTIALTRDALSLTTSKYVHWDEFRDRLGLAVAALTSNYQPAYFGRVGLRYRDLICREELGLSGVHWTELLQPHITGELASTDITSDVTVAARQLVVSLPEQRGQVLLQHGLSKKDGSDETCFAIDADFHSTERTEVGDVWGLLEGLHSQAGRLFRWCIRGRLHTALDPRPVSDERAGTFTGGGRGGG